MEKRAPKIKVLVFPQGDIDRVAGAGAGDAFAVQDIFSGYLVQQQGEGGDSGSAPGFEALQWQGQRAFDFVERSLEFVRFQKDGKVLYGVPGIAANEGLGGWTLRAVSAPTNCIVTPARQNDPQPKNRFERIEWRATKGDDWESCVPAEPPYKSCIRHRSQQPDRALEIASEPIEPPFGVEAELIWGGVFAEHTKDPGVRLVLIDKKFSIVWRRIGKTACKPTLERWRNTPEGSGWELWKRLEEAAPATFEGRSLVRLQVIGGRLVLGLDGVWVCLMETRQLPSSEPDVPGAGMPVPAETVWPKSRMRLSVYGVDVTLGVSLLSASPSGSIRRTVRAPFARPADAPNETTGFTGGWKPAGTRVLLHGTRDANTVTYQLQLFADRKQRAAPFVSNAVMLFPGGMARERAEPIDLRPALLTVKYSSGEPELLPTSEVQMELSRNLLDQQVPNWESYIQPFAPIRVLAAWDYDDEGAITPGEWTRVFEGYIVTPDKALPGYKQENLSIVARDPLIRLKAPAGFVDERYAPLDYLFMQRDTAPLYDGECVQYLLETELGSRIAGTLNGNGNPLLFSDNLQPILSVEMDRVGYFQMQAITGLSTQSSFMLPPPFGKDVYSWIHDEIARPMNAVFYWGYSPFAPIDSGQYSFGTQPLVPIYGRIDLIMAALGSAPKVLPDAIYLDGDANDLIGSASVSTLTDKLFNEVVVWGRKPEGVAEGLTPAFFGGRARLAPEAALAAENSWRRVLLEQHDIIGTIAGNDYAQAMAIITLREFEGSLPRHVTVVMPRGDETVRWGMKIQPKMQATGSDLTLGINDEVLRVQRVSHTWDLTGNNPERAFVTELVCRPLSATGY